MHDIEILEGKHSKLYYVYIIWIEFDYNDIQNFYCFIVF